MWIKIEVSRGATLVPVNLREARLLCLEAEAQDLPGPKNADFLNNVDNAAMQDDVAHLTFES